MAYDDQNIFARILRGELPAIKIYEDELKACAIFCLSIALVLIKSLSKSE